MHPTVQAGIGALQTGMQAPNISQFFNPFQSYVTDEINRQAAMAQNQLGAQAVQVVLLVEEDKVLLKLN